MLTKYIQAIKTLTLLLIVSVSLPAYSYNIIDYDRVKNDPEFAAYITGVAAGLAIANIENMQAGAPQLYCQPDLLELTTEKSLDILRRSRIKLGDIKKVNPNTPMVILFFHGLQATFPCK